jgi:predicted secreted acid phosphatase
MRCVIFDIDGTLADASHRVHHIKKQPKDWDAFFAETPNDKPVPHIVELLRLVRSSGWGAVVFVSGRPERTRGDTVAWLRKHNIHNTEYHGQLRLFMRADGDRRDDDIVKYEILQRMRGDGLSPIMAFDDRDRVVKMWRENNVPTLQVAEGNF